MAPRDDDPAPAPALARVLTAWDLVALGVGSSIGAGLFEVLGRAARDYSGPWVSLSFLVASVACLLSAFCFAELAGLVPSSGSAYSFASRFLGPWPGFLVGWALVLEYGVSAAAVARGWSAYVDHLAAALGWPLPRFLTHWSLPSQG